MEALFDAVSLLMDCDVSAVTEGEPDLVALRLDAARRCQVLAKELADACELQLLDAMGKDEKFAIDGVGVVHRKVRAKTRAKEGGTDAFRKDLAVAVAMETGTDTFSGEINDIRRLAGLDAARTLLSLVNLYPGNMSARGKRRFAIDSYTEVSWEPYIVIEDAGMEPEGDSAL